MGQLDRIRSSACENYGKIPRVFGGGMFRVFIVGGRLLHFARDQDVPLRVEWVNK